MTADETNKRIYETVSALLELHDLVIKLTPEPTNCRLITKQWDKIDSDIKTVVKSLNKLKENTNVT